MAKPELLRMRTKSIPAAEDTESEDEDEGNASETSTWRSSSAQGNENHTWRGEISHWLYHMKEVEKWPRDARGSKEWTKLKDLLKEFTKVKIFWRWLYQYLKLEGLGVETKSGRLRYWGPAHLSAHLNLEVYQDFLLEHKSHYLHKYQYALGSFVPLHFEDTFYLPGLVQHLIKKKPGITSETNIRGFTPFLICLTLSELQGDFERESNGVKKLVQSLKHLISEEGADLNICLRSLPNLPLQRVIATGNEELLEKALVKDNPCVDLELQDDHERTALHSIFSKRCRLPQELQLSMGRRLLEAGANYNAEDRHSRMPLYKAVAARNVEAVKLLLEFPHPPLARLKINDDDDKGQTALTKLVSKYHDHEVKKGLAIIDLLIQYDVDLNYREKEDGLRAWMLAIWYENWEYAEKLLEAHEARCYGSHKYLMATDMMERTMIHKAADDSNGIRMMELILPKMADEEKETLLNKKDKNGRTALHVAVQNFRIGTVAYLLKNKADPFTEDSTGESAGNAFLRLWTEGYDYRYWSYEARQLIKDLIPQHATHKHLLTIISNGRNDLAEVMIESGFDPLKKDDGGWDTFDWAYARGHRNQMATFFPDHDIDYEDRKSAWENSKSLMTWSRENTHEFVELSDDNLESSVDHSHNDHPGSLISFSAATKSAISPYVSQFYYEVEIVDAYIPDGSVIGIGLTTGPPPLDRFPGWETPGVVSYGLHGDDGNVFSPECRKTTGEEWAKLPSGSAQYGVGSVVGCGYDQENHNIFWTLDGEYLGVGFKGVKKQLYPAMASNGGYKAIANFGQKPFLWQGDKDSDDSSDDEDDYGFGLMGMKEKREEKPRLLRRPSAMVPFPVSENENLEEAAKDSEAGEEGAREIDDI
ncbi:Delta-latroinsectotoxin [Dactylella cylindrospora]|nr:Delta-latroinsectotoxin [Dactylella cylindrospora]